MRVSTYNFVAASFLEVGSVPSINFLPERIVVSCFKETSIYSV